MDYTFDEIESFIEQLCKRLEVEMPDINIGTAAQTCLFWPRERFTPFINIDPKCRFSNGAMPLEVVLAHEIRHWWQYKTGKLSPPTAYTLRMAMNWEGQTVPYIWNAAPWEIDAVQFENEIAIEMGFPVLRFVNNGTIFELDSKTELKKVG